MKEIKKAVITAAGWGTRFLPVTKAQPKEMLPLLNKPVIQYCVEEAIACGIDLVVIVTALGKRAIEDYFDRSFELEQTLTQRGDTRLAEEIRRLSDMVDICYVRQKQQLGLGHAVLTARRVIGDETFVLFLPDDIFEQGERLLRRMLQINEEHGGSVLTVKKVTPQETCRYGIIEATEMPDRVYRVTDLVEKPLPGEAPSDLAVMGRYVLTPDVFRILEQNVKEHAREDDGREIQLTDALRELCHKNPIFAYEFEGERYDAGTLQGWLMTQTALALRDPDIGPEFRRNVEELLKSGAGRDKIDAESGR